jgi:hypothetical protein
VGNITVTYQSYVGLHNAFECHVAYPVHQFITNSAMYFPLIATLGSILIRACLKVTELLQMQPIYGQQNDNLSALRFLLPMC